VASFGDTHYVPFLKGKAAEFDALRQLPANRRESLTPLIDVPPEAVEFHPGGSFQIATVEKSLDGYAGRLAAAWGATGHCFIDIAGFHPDSRLSGGRHPITAFFADARGAELSPIPVTGPDRDRAQVDAVKAVCDRWRLGVAIRVRRPQLREPALLAQRLETLLRALSLEPADADLLLDFGELLRGNVAEVEAEAIAGLAALPRIEKWRSLTLCSGAFPAEISSFVGTDESGERPRRDFDLWLRLCESSSLPRLPSYGDCTVAPADWSAPFNPMEMNPSCKIVYATDDEWLIEKGRSIRNHGGGQYRVLAGKMKRRPGFLAPAHCQTEKKIIDCAAGRGGTGGLRQWLTAATRHHLEVVSRQLASLP